MKKVSTGATKQSRNFSQQRLTIGLDLGDRSELALRTRRSGAIRLEQRLSTTPKALREGFRGMPHRRAYPYAATTTPIASEAIKRSRERQASVVVDLPLARPSHTKRSHRCEDMGNS
jgi:transposase